MILNLEKLFSPDTVAVFGVSTTNPFHPANVVFSKNLLRYEAKSYCINPNGGTLYGETIYRRIQDIPERVDLAVLAIRAEHVPGALRDCIETGVSGAVVISGGFSETGRTVLQDELIALSGEHEFPFIGPNCLGIFSPPQVDTFFLPHERLVEPEEGAVTLVSQSGGILVDLMIKLTQEGVGVSRAVSIGNKAVVDEVDLLRFFQRDPETRVIGLYVEGFKVGRGRAFVEAVGESDKPVVLLKSGKTPGGSRAVSSHTASLAGDYAVFHDVVAQSGAREARNETEFVSYCEALCCHASRTVEKICIITGSGGHGAIASDIAFDRGLSIAEVPEADQEALRRTLSPSVQPIASLSNPVDLTGSAGDDDFFAAVKFFLETDYVDCIVLLLLPYLPGISPDIGARLFLLSRQFRKPIVAYLPHVDKYRIFIEGLESNGVPVAHSVEGAVYMAEAMMPRRRGGE